MAGRDNRSKIWCAGLLFALFLTTSCSREGVTEIPDDNMPPAVPSNVQIFAAHDGAAGIEWTRNPASNISGYNIYRSVNDTNNFSKITLVTESHYVDFPLEYELTYFYKITAVNKLNKESAFSAIVNAISPNVYPPLPVYEISINGRNNINSKFIHLQWTPRDDYDIKGYEIYRSSTNNVEIIPQNLTGFSETPEYTDSSVDILKKYYYKIISVDKGNLKSDSSHSVSDLIIDIPVPVSPADNAVAKNLYRVQFKTASVPCRYKIIIQTNELYGTVAEYEFYSDRVNEIISYDINPASFTSYRKYFWRVITYSGTGNEPNSYSQLFSFTYVAE